MTSGEKQAININIKANLKELFQNQKDFFNSTGRFSTVKDRIQKILKIKKWILANRELILNALHSDMKKNQVEADLTELMPVLWEIDHTVKNLAQWAKPASADFKLAMLGTSSEIIHQPLGVVLIISPWNFPFNLCIGPLISALSAGNCVLIKPSEHSPATSEAVNKLVADIFKPEEVLCCTGDEKVAEELLTLPFNHIFFTGSPAIGKVVMKAAAEHLTSVTLELGGCNPAIIDATTDVKDAAQKLFYNKFLNAGQSCLSVNFVVAHKTIYQELLQNLKEEYDRLFTQNHSKAVESYTHIINNRHFKRIEKLIEDSKKEGAIIFAGGEKNEQTNYLSPTIMTSFSEHAPVMKEEIFGPLLPVKMYENLEEVISFLNGQPAPLALYVFSTDESTISKVINSTQAGTSCINDTTLQFIHPNLPFGGVNNSGIGKAHGYAGFKAFSNARSVLRQRVGFTTFKLVYPPYTAKVKALARWIMKFF